MKSMTPEEEARSIKEHPLPPIVTEADTMLPVRIYQTDMEILTLEASLKILRGTREELLNRALEMGALEDEYCRILFKERQTRILDPVLFRATFPAAYALVIAHERAVIAEKENHIGEVVPLGLADQLVGKPAVTSICTIVIEKTPFVTRKDRVE